MSKFFRIRGLNYDLLSPLRQRKVRKSSVLGLSPPLPVLAPLLVPSPPVGPEAVDDEDDPPLAELPAMERRILMGLDVAEEEAAEAPWP